MSAGADLAEVDEESCAQCGASLAAGAQWCSLCYAPVAAVGRTDVAPATRDADEVDGHAHSVLVAPAPDLPALLVAPASPATDEHSTWPCLGCGEVNPMQADVCGACGLAFLAPAKSPPSLQIPYFGDIFAKTRPEQIWFISIAGVVSVAVLLGVMALFGLFI